MRLNIGVGLSHEELALPIRKYTVPLSTAFHEVLTIREVLKSIRKRKIEHILRYFYSVDEANRITGVLSTRELLLADPAASLASVVDRDVLTLEQNETLEQGLKCLETYGFQALPIVDADGHIVGLFEVTSEILPHHIDPKRLVQKVTSKDLYQMIGLSLHLGRLNSTLMEFRDRMPWLFCTLFAGLVCATVLALFSDLLAEYIILALFLPLVLAIGEAVSMQSMTLSLLFLHYGKVHWKKFLSRILTEWKTAILLGIACAFLVGSLFWVWNSTFYAMVSVSVSIFGAILFSTTLGTLLPVILHSLSLDPKVAAGPVVLMLADITAITIYLVLSKWLLHTFVNS